jgi:hypothetical protein
VEGCEVGSWLFAMVSFIVTRSARVGSFAGVARRLELFNFRREGEI